MTDLYAVPPQFSAASNCNKDNFDTQYQRSISDNDAYWAEHAHRIDWIKPFTKVKNVSYAKDDLHIRWFEDGTLNASANCIDRHLATKANKTAIIWEGDTPNDSMHISYQELHDQTCRLANVMKSNGVKKGDRVIIYMPMIVEAAYAMLACARIGAVHSVVFGGFSPDALANRIEDCGATAIITADEGMRGAKIVPLKANVVKALENPTTKCITNIFEVKYTGNVVPSDSRDVDLKAEMATESTICPPQEMNAEDPLFILYTSGSTGKPKGVLHTTGGYMVYASMTHEYVFDLKEDDVYWCTADVGWVTGHSYILYGPLANGATTLMFEGLPTYPDAGRCWEICDKHNVTIFYTAPTAIRALMQQGDDFVTKHSRQSIRLLGSVGEPINPEAWRWYHNVVGDRRCPIVDTWWQTETGGILIAPLPGAIDLKPGSATKPFFGIQPALVDGDGNLLEGEAEGNLVILDSWPGQMRSVYGDHQRFIDTYFATFEGMYFTGDGARRDADGYYWITGRVDDVLNISGHRLGTAEIESALVLHPDVAEAAVVGFPHDLTGQGIYCYVILNNNVQPTDDLNAELINQVRSEIGPFAKPHHIQCVPGLPKTRSGKIMRRILRKIAENDFDNLGDISTLAEPAVVQGIIGGRLNK